MLPFNPATLQFLFIWTFWCSGTGGTGVIEGLPQVNTAI